MNLSRYLYLIPLAALVIVYSGCSYTVTSETANIKSYQVYITKLSDPKKQFPCMILQLLDSGIVIQRDTVRSFLPADDILHVRVQIKRDAAKGLGAGLAAGFVIGAVLGTVFIDEHNDPASVIFGTAAAFAAIGGISGALSNTTLNLSYPVNGRLKYYQSIREKLEKYSGYGKNYVP